MYKVTFCNPGGELDSRVVATEEEAAEAVRDMLSDCPFNDGDSITCVEVEE